MDKLQYDSFYKFLVSIGAILIAAPVIGIYQLFTGSYDIIMSEQEYSNLSGLSLLSLENRAKMLKFISSVFPWVCLVIIAIGLVCVVYGCRKWYLLQKEIDEQTHLETLKKRIDAKQLTTPEVVERTIDEVIENNEINIPMSMDSQKKAIVDAIQIEDQYCDFLKRRLPNKYSIKQNLRIGKSEYDIVAISGKDKTDLLYEIKYWNTPKPMHLLSQVLERIKVAGQNYENISNRNYRFKLIIISDPELLSDVRAACERYLAKHDVDFPPFTDIDYFSTEEIR